MSVDRRTVYALRASTTAWSKASNSSDDLSDEGDLEISVVVPVFNSAMVIPELCSRVAAALCALDVSHEIILVDDGSSDGSFDAVRAQAARNPAIRVIKMVRNFGQHPAITAGLLHARGRWVVLMDDDLQTPPEEIERLYRKAQEGFDIVHGERITREDSLVRRLGSRLAQALMRLLFDSRCPDTISSFRIISRRVVDTYLRLPESHTYVAALMSWMGYPHTAIPVAHGRSKVGRSRYGTIKLVVLWWNIAVAFSNRPLKLATWAGFLLSAVAGVLGLRVLITYFTAEHPVAGYTSLFVSQMLFSGLILMFLGILGEYLGRVYQEVKGRPYFLIDYDRSIGLLPSHTRAGIHERT